MASSIQKHLKTLGLNQKDIDVFYTVLKLGIARATEIARAIDLPRQTTYSILNTLVDIGLVNQHDKRGIKHFSSEPRRILDLIKQKRETLAEQERDIEKELPKLETLRFRASPLPHIQYYEGTSGLKRLLDDILVQHKKGEKQFRGYGVNMMQARLGDALSSFIKKRASLDVKTQLFIGQGPDDLGIEKGALGRTVKRLAMPSQDAALYIAGDSIYLFSYLDNVGLVIKNRAIAKLLKGVFDDQWARVK